MCLQCCLEDTDCCAGSDVVWECVPGLCCGYGEQSHVYITCCVSFCYDVQQIYLVSMPGEVKDPTRGVNVQHVIDSQILVGF